MESTDTIQSETQTETAPEVQETEQTPAPENQAFDPAKIDPKVKEHFEKEYTTKYRDYDSLRRSVQELNAIKNDPNFQKWITERNAPAKPTPFELTDDQFTAALTDKGQFAKLVQDAAKHLLQNEVQPKLQQTEQHFQIEAKKNELHETIRKFPDFKELDKRGLIEPIIRKYGNIGFEDAYWIAKQHTYKEEVAAAARGQVNNRKGSSVERGNNAPSDKKSIEKVGDRLEAMTRTAEDLAAGREPGEYDWD